MSNFQWQLLDSGTKSAAAHMQMDEELLKNLSQDPRPLLHFYDFDCDSATYGYFTNPQDHLNLDNAKKLGLELARRPTGGGITFHLTDFVFSVLLPNSHPGFSKNTLNNYAFINAIVANSLMELIAQKEEVSLLSKESNEDILEASYFCMAKPTKYDLIIKGQKLGGAAQRATKFGLLHQGTIALYLPSDDYLRQVLKTPKILNCMKKNSYLLLKTDEEQTLKSAKEKLKKLLTDQFFSS